MSVSSAPLPTAMATRPQLGSAPCTAVLTSGELTTALPTRLAWASSRAPVTRTSMRVVAPSPSAASFRVSSRATRSRAASKVAGSTGPAPPLAMMAAVSLVEVSVSTLRALSVRSTTRRNTASSSSGARAASVQNRAMRVAMSGSIMPTPLAMPTMRAAPAEALATFSTVSVVIMARAAASGGAAPRGSAVAVNVSK